jgi:hypothetical protein
MIQGVTSLVPPTLRQTLLAVGYFYAGAVTLVTIW